MASTISQPPDKGFLQVIGGSIILHIVVITVGLILLNRTPARDFLTPVYSVSLVAPGKSVTKKSPVKKVIKRRVPKKAAPIKEKTVKAVPVKTKTLKSVTIQDDSAAKAKKIKERKAKRVESAVEDIKESIRRREEQALVASKITELGARKKAEESEIDKRLAAIKNGLRFLDEKKKEVAEEEAFAPGTANSEAAGIEASLYLSLLKDLVQSEWTYHEVLRNRDLSVIVAIKIDRDGRLVELKVEKSSGNPRFDDSLLRAVKEAAPFSPLPKGIKDAYLETGLRFCPTCKQ